MTKLQIFGLLVAPFIKWCWDVIHLKEKPYNLLMKRSIFFTIFFSIGALAWLVIFCFHIQGECSFLVFMNKEGLMENFHQMGSYLLHMLLLKRKKYGKPNDACFLFVVELMARKLVIFQIVYDLLYLPKDMNPDLFDNLLKRLFCKGLLFNLIIISCTLILNL